MKIGGSLKNVLLVASNLPCFSLQRWVSCGPPPSHGLLFPRLSTADSQRWRDSQGEGIRRRREGSGQGNRGWMVVWHEDQTDCNAKEKKRKRNPLHPPHPEPCIPSFSPSAPLWEGQTSTDWIWFICARIIWTLLRIFFWWPANVTPTLRMSLWGQTEADVRLMLSTVSVYLSIYPQQHNITR